MTESLATLQRRHGGAVVLAAKVLGGEARSLGPGRDPSRHHLFTDASEERLVVVALSGEPSSLIDEASLQLSAAPISPVHHETGRILPVGRQPPGLGSDSPITSSPTPAGASMWPMPSWISPASVITAGRTLGAL